MCCAIKFALKILLIAISVVLFLGFIYMIYYITTLDHKVRHHI